jgi:hypothetical protein
VANAISLTKFTPLRLSLLLYHTFQNVLPVSTVSPHYPVTQIQTAILNRQLPPLRLAGRQFRLKFSSHPAEPDESKIAFELPTYTSAECMRQIARTYVAFGVVTIVTEIPD